MENVIRLKKQRKPSNESKNNIKQNRKKKDEKINFIKKDDFERRDKSSVHGNNELNSVFLNNIQPPFSNQ
jgi:hypothetical protein